MLWRKNLAKKNLPKKRNAKLLAFAKSAALPLRKRKTNASAGHICATTVAHAIWIATFVIANTKDNFLI